MRSIRTLIIHCSDTPPSMDVGAAEIRAWHLQQGYSDIGYHYVVRRDGTLETGRPLEQAGAHCKGRNAESVGICLVGGRKAGTVPPGSRPVPENNFTPAQFDTLGRVLDSLLKSFPKAVVHGHRDFAAKDCPCFDAPAWWAHYQAGR